MGTTTDGKYYTTMAANWRKENAATIKFGAIIYFETPHTEHLEYIY